MEQGRTHGPKKKRAKPSVTCGHSGGISRQRGKPCENPPTKGRTRCRFHGGHTKRGADHPRYRPGSWSAVVPARLAEKLERLVVDDGLYDLRQDVALANVRIEELLSQLQSKSTARWDLLAEAYDLLDAAIKTGKAEVFTPALLDLRNLIKEGHKDDSLWEKIQRAKEHRLRLIESERRWLVDAGQMITSERLAALATEIQFVIKSAIENPNVPRQELCAVIGQGFYMLMNRGHEQIRKPQVVDAETPGVGRTNHEYHGECRVDLPGEPGRRHDAQDAAARSQPGGSNPVGPDQA